MKQQEDIKKLWELFKTFFRIGCFTFGGGFAMIPLIEREVVDKKKWVKEEEVMDVFAVAQSIPGAIAINSSTFIGYKIAGRKGALVATLGVILPSFFIITIIAAFFSRFQEEPIVKAAFLGVRSCVVALIIVAGAKFAKGAVKDKLTSLVLMLTIIAIVFFDVQAILLIIAGIIMGTVQHKLALNKLKNVTPKGGKSNDLF